ncbi:MAG: hypothetical protein ABR576_05915 [Thermoanaerobaculia bacterium]
MASAALLALAALTACAREKPAEARPLSSGDAVWLRDGVGPDAASLEDALVSSGFSAVFLPARTLRSEGDRFEGAPAGSPPVPLARIPVVLVVHAGEDFATTLRTASGQGRKMLVDSAGRVVQGAIADRQLFGRVVGLHLDLPFTADGLDAYSEVIRAARRQVPAQYRLTASLRIAPNEEEREALGKLPLDGWTANVFGEQSPADPVAVDTLGKPWWAVFSPAARGVVRGADGSVRRVLPERYLAVFSDRPDVDLTHDLSWKEEWASAYFLRPRARIAWEDTIISPGEVISFSHPSLPEMLSRLGADVAARRNVRGRVIALEGLREEDRIFTLAALGDVLLGRSLDPDLRVAVGPAGPRALSVGGENRTAHTSAVSRTGNWVEVEMPGFGIRDVLPGGFERYETYDAEERPVTLGRAVRVRFFETLVGAFERIAPAVVTLPSAPRQGCCRWRSRYISAAGREITTDWAPPEPTATPAARRPGGGS